MAEKFSRQVCQQLDKSVEALDPELELKLAMARRAALLQQSALKPAPTRRANALFRPIVYWPALAAALLAVVVVPNLSTPVRVPIDSGIEAQSLYDLEPELLETMDLLWAVEELAERDMRAL
ncbi:hypothetical protein [Simiduia litorea]|uniref:hypothetical protein n=1 Tax=Simiduia litorea TaxID=1435348 RepID=UPI0036F289F7